MDLFSPWYFAAIIFVAMVVVSPKRLFASIDSGSTAGRLDTLDGLRGFLALAVFAHHAAITYGFLKTGNWALPPSNFYKLLGQTGVSFFFMITGYLFWSRLLNARESVDWKGLFIGRIFRIGPLYLFAAIVAITISLHRTSWSLKYPISDVALQVAQWLALGLYGQPAVNGYNTGQLLAGVTWTIYYEWIFYFALPALSIAAASRSHLAIIVTAIWMIPRMPSVFPDPEKYLITLFLCGMLTASLHKKFPGMSLKSPPFSVAAVCLLGYLYANFDTAFDWTAIAIMMGFFLIVASGSSLFGLLTSRPALRLGNISYSIYLLHGLTLTAMFSPKFPLGAWAMASTRHYWAAIMITAIAVVLVSIAAYLLIERPGISIGKQLSKALKTGYWKAAPKNVNADQVPAG